MFVITKTYQPNKYILKLKAESADHLKRLDSFIQEFFTTFSRESLKAKIRKGEITIIGRSSQHRPSTRIHKGDIIEAIIYNSTHENVYWNNKKIEIDQTPKILYEDENIYIISKPPFMTTHPTGRHIFNCATVYFEEILKKKIHSIHRIDRETSGVLILGKSPSIADKMREYFERNVVFKCYFFIGCATHKKIPNESFIANERLFSEEKKIITQPFPEDSLKGKASSTIFKIIHRSNDYVFGLAFPKTGRQHQIRVHAMVKGFPLLGDKLYLGNYKLFQRFKDLIATQEDHNLMEIPRHALHAIGISLPYKQQTFIDSIPKDLEIWMSKKNIPYEEFKSDLNKKILDYLAEKKI